MRADNFSARYVGRPAFDAGNYRFTATADDGVRVYLDGVRIIDRWLDQAATTYSATRTVRVGVHEVRVEYFEHRGAAVIKLRIAAVAQAVDTTPPNVSVTSPVAGATLSDRVTVAAEAADNIGVTGVQFKLDGANLGTEDAAAPYSIAWDTRTATNGAHTLSAIARDAAGNTARGADVPVTVRNQAPPPTVEPGPIAGQGYRQVFRDDFSTLNRSVWDDHIWYDDAPDPRWVGFQEVDSNGVLHLRTSRRFTGPSGDYPINTVTTLSSGRSFQYGYFEARMKWSAGHGSWPAFWLLSTSWAKTGSCSASAGEIDVMEGQGSEPNVFYGTVHQDSANRCEGHRQNDNGYQPLGFPLADDFHTYAVLWTPTTVTWYVDGRMTHSAATYPDDNQAMFLLLDEWVGGWTFDADATTPDVIENQVDYVSVWQK